MIDRESTQKALQCRSSDYPKILENRFPHILKKIVSLWDSPDAEGYFADLLQPNGRGGGRMDRNGFSEQAWDEILHLHVLHVRSRSRTGR